MTVTKKSFSHATGVQLCVPHSRFVPRPQMSALTIAQGLGADARRRGRKADANPYPPEQGNLADAWSKGYGE